MGNKYIHPEAGGHENKNKRTPAQREKVNNLYCPRDGHYCEQPSCADCMAETVDTGAWHESS